MQTLRAVLAALLVTLALPAAVPAQDTSWPREVTFALLSTENAAEITRRWGSILAHLEKDLGVKVKAATATEYRGTIEALKFKKAELGHLGPKAYVEASNNDYANVVRLVSLMDHTPGQRQFTSLAKYREYNRGKFGLGDAELDALIARRREDQEKYGDRHRAAILRLCETRALPLASHDDATVGHVEEAAKAGMTIAEFPTTLEAARAARAYGLAILGGGPNLVMGRSHSGNVSALELVAEGLLDIVSSDYVPASALHAAFLLHTRHRQSLPVAIAAVTATPAERVGLDDRGEIAPGKRADVVRVRAVGDVPLVTAVWRAGRRVA